MSPTVEILFATVTILFWLAPLLIVAACVAAGGCVRVAEMFRRTFAPVRPAALVE